MTAREQEIYDDLTEDGQETTFSPARLARVLARLEQQKPGGDACKHYAERPFVAKCGADYNDMYTTQILNHVTCPACLKLMRDGTGKEQQATCTECGGGRCSYVDHHLPCPRCHGTGKEPAPPAPTIKELLGKVAAEDADMCVCGHPRSDHYYQGGVSACAVAGCACGPGCIHEGFVRADGVVEPAPPAAPEPGKSRGEEVAEKMVQLYDQEGAYKNLLWLRGYRERDGGQVIFPGLKIPECIGFLRKFLLDAIDAERAAAAGEARRKALEEAERAVEKIDVLFMHDDAQVARDRALSAIRLLMLAAAAAPAGEGSKA